MSGLETVALDQCCRSRADIGEITREDAKRFAADVNLIRFVPVAGVRRGVVDNQSDNRSNRRRLHVLELTFRASDGERRGPPPIWPFRG